MNFKITYKQNDKESYDYISAPYYSKLKERLEYEHPDWDIVKIDLEPAS